MEQAISFLRTKAQIIRFIIAGGSSAVSNLLVLYFLAEFVGMHYLMAEVIGFIIGFFVTFFLQKFWTFQNVGKKSLSGQMVQTLILAGANFVLNLFLLYFFAEIFHFWYFGSEIFVIIIIAINNYFIYKNYIFK